MKQHRWVQIIWMPCLLTQNEDHEWFARIDPNREALEYPLQYHCFDCEQCVTDAWGTPCPGRLGTGREDDVDDRIPAELWEALTYGKGSEGN